MDKLLSALERISRQHKSPRIMRPANARCGVFVPLLDFCQVRGINWIGILAWIIGGGFALLETLGVVSVFSSALDGVILSFAAYWILYSLLKNTGLAGSGSMSIEEACSVAQ